MLGQDLITASISNNLVEAERLLDLGVDKDYRDEVFALPFSFLVFSLLDPLSLFSEWMLGFLVGMCL